MEGALEDDLEGHLVRGVVPVVTLESTSGLEPQHSLIIVVLLSSEDLSENGNFIVGHIVDAIEGRVVAFVVFGSRNVLVCETRFLQLIVATGIGTLTIVVPADARPVRRNVSHLEQDAEGCLLYTSPSPRD